MKITRRQLRKLIIEHMGDFLSDMQSSWPEDLPDVENDDYGYLTGRRDGRTVKTAWAKHVDRAWVDDMIYVHYTEATYLLHGNPTRYFGGSHKKSKKTSEISCEAFKSSRLVKPYSNHGEVGLVIKGFVTLLGNNEDEMFTGSTSSYEKQMPNRKIQSGTNKGVLKRTPSTFVLGAEDYLMPDDNRVNEALLDNWEVVAIFSHRASTRKDLTKKLHTEMGLTHIPIIDPYDADFNLYKNNR